MLLGAPRGCFRAKVQPIRSLFLFLSTDSQAGTDLPLMKRTRPCLLLYSAPNGEGARSRLVLPGLGTGRKVNRRTGRLGSRLGAVICTGLLFLRPLVRESDAVPSPRRARSFACRGQFDSSLRLSAVLAHTMPFCAHAGSLRLSKRRAKQPRHYEPELAIASHAAREARTGQSAETNCP